MGIVVLILLFFSPSPLESETGYTVREHGFIPVRYYVGDIVDLRMRITGSDAVPLKSPTDMPGGKWLDILYKNRVFRNSTFTRSKKLFH